MRINVIAPLADQADAKFLVVVDEMAGMNQLVEKVQRYLKGQGVYSTVAQILNSFQATLPADELLGNCLRDGEEITVLLRGDDGQMLQQPLGRVVRRSPRAAAAPPPPAEEFSRSGLEYANPGATPIAGATALLAVPSGPNQFGVIGGGGDAARVLPVRASVTLPPQLQHGGESSSDEESDGSDEPFAPIEDYPPLPHMPKNAPPGAAGIPGPNEELELERMPYETMWVDHPHDPVTLNSYDNDWLVENLTPRLRQFIMSRFQSDLITEPKYVPSIGKFVAAKFLQASGSFVSVFMRPQTAIASDPNATMPVHYNIPKSELFLFQRKIEQQIDQLQQHQEQFRGSIRALKALLGKGMSETDHVNIMLPHSYDVLEEVEGTMLEAEKPLLPITSVGSHPIVIIDSSGAVGDHLGYVKAAVKRALHTHVVGKKSFQMIRLVSSTGKPRLWAQAMTPPTEVALQYAEDWIDCLVPAPAYEKRLEEAVRFALAHKECDEIYIISSGCKLRPALHEQILNKIRSSNKAEVAINTIGVDPDPEGELLLRNISESNHGDFTLKSFQKQGIGRANAIPTADSRWTSWRTNLVNEKSQQLANSFKKEKMCIGSQIKIIEVMQREETRRENSLHEEWRCASRLLAAQHDPKSPALVQDRDMVKELERKTTRTLTARVGGGYLYDTREVTIGMEHLFEHKSAVSWTANSDTMAIGPKVPMPDAGQDRTAKLPPSSESMPLAPAQDAERSYDRPKNRAQEFRDRIANGGGRGGN